MKEILIIIDGMENDLYKYMKNLKNIEVTECVDNTPEGMETETLNCTMSMLGYKKEEIPKGRGFLESLANNILVTKNDLVFRCNKVKFENEILISNCENHKKIFINNKDIFLKHMVSYKYILVLKNKREFFETIKTFPPHQNIGCKKSEILPVGENSVKEILVDLVNNYSIFPWGQAFYSEGKSFYEKTGKKSAIVCKTEILKGIAKYLKMYSPDIKNSTGDIDTDLGEKAKIALKLIKDFDFVLLHINGGDESSHRKDLGEKIEFIKKIDEIVISSIFKNSPRGTKIIITADHETSSLTGKHIRSKTNKFIFKL